MKFKTRRRIRREALENAKKVDDITKPSIPKTDIEKTKEKPSVLPKKEMKTTPKNKHVKPI